jgi:hypothetical protein
VRQRTNGLRVGGRLKWWSNGRRQGRCHWRRSHRRRLDGHGPPLSPRDGLGRWRAWARTARRRTHRQELGRILIFFAAVSEDRPPCGGQRRRWGCLWWRRRAGDHRTVARRASRPRRRSQIQRRCLALVGIIHPPCRHDVVYNEYRRWRIPGRLSFRTASG